MSLLQAAYRQLPDSIQPVAKRWYFNTIKKELTDSQLRSRFISNFFDSEDEYQRYVSEFEGKKVSDIRESAVNQYSKMTGRDEIITIAIETACDYYAMIRHLRPFVVVETGVCHGMSTLAILLALRENQRGHLYSIDYPFYVDKSIEEFRAETYEEFGGAALPSDKEPGWIVPDELRDRWTLITGKSQRELPILLPQLDGLDVFIHDSEHSTPCMMFEYELAWEWLNDNGTIISDDITWGEAWPLFLNEREGDDGKLSNNVGYIHK